MREVSEGQLRVDHDYWREPIERKIEVARPYSSQSLTIERGVNVILDGLEVVSNILSRHTYQLLTFKNTARTQRALIGFTIDELMVEAMRVSQQINIANRASFEAVENMVINMHYFSTHMKSSTDRIEQQIIKLE